MKIWEGIKACFKRNSSKKEERSPYSNEKVSKVPKDKMMERIAHVVKGAKEEQEKKGRDEGYQVGWVGSRSTKRKVAQRYWFKSNS